MEIFLFVMFRLIADVFPHGLDVHRADAELAITRLPRKIGILGVEGFDPTRGRRFDLLHELGGCVAFGLRKQDVDVVADGIDFDQGRVVVFEDARDVSVELAAFFVAQELAAPFRAEHEMNDEVGE